MRRVRHVAAVEMPVASEHEEQKQLISLVDAAYPADVAALLYAIPNGGDRNPVVGMKLKLEGVRRGVPDLFFAYPHKGFHGLYIEMKRRHGGRVSPEQELMIEALKRQGYKVEVCKGCDEAFKVFNEYLGR